MARFVFQLQGVLRHREQVEREKMRIVAEAQGRLTALETELRALDQRVQDASKNARENHLVGVLDMAFIAAHRRFMNSAQRQAMELVQTMGKAKQQLGEAQKHLLEAAKQKKIIEKLREKQHARWQAEQAHAETIALDEMSMQLAFRSALDDGEGVE
jgi:flagellar FliJ protein